MSDNWASTIPLRELSNEALDLRVMIMTLVKLDGRGRADAAEREAAQDATIAELRRRGRA